MIELDALHLRLELPPVPLEKGVGVQQHVMSLVGCINADVWAFPNLIALPETLLLTDVDAFPGIEPDGKRMLRCRLLFRHLRQRGPCEDGVTRHVGWNRLSLLYVSTWDGVYRWREVYRGVSREQFASGFPADVFALSLLERGG